MKKKVNALLDALRVQLPVDRVRLCERLADHTTFAIGGPADVFVEPINMDELSFALQTIHSMDVPLTILGGGSNMLVRDGGIRGVVVSLRHMTQVMECEGNQIVIGAGYMLKDASEFAYEQGLTGLEFAIGIPGTIGGAVFMNAGAYDGEMSNIVTEVHAVDRYGQRKVYPLEKLQFAYRHSVFQQNGEVIGEVVMTLQPGDKETIRKRMDDLTHRRESKQPLEFASAGSTFKRPPGHFVGTLIEQTGLKGLAVGDARVSEKHAGFVINAGHASARDVLALIQEIQRQVYEHHGVELEPEVRMIGEDIQDS